MAGTPSSPRPFERSRTWWWLAIVAGAIALVAIARWLWALASGTPILYGEGAVAHAALLARDRLEYAAPADPNGAIFIAANYPPLYFHIAGLAGPFVAGRLASIGSALFVSVAVARTAVGRGGPLIAVALAASWLSSMPVATWGAAVKPDLVALALTVTAVLAADERRRPGLAGVLIALATWSKPTAALPALALAAYLAPQRGPLIRYVAGFTLASAATLLLTSTDPRAMFEHVVVWNALPWHADQALLLLALLVIVFGAPALLYAFARPSGAVAAYALAATGIVILGGREGATVNYLLDIVTAVTLGLARSDAGIARGAVRPLLIAAQLVIALVLLDPFGLAPGRSITTGTWSSPARLAVVHGIPGDLLVEDSGLLLADGRTPRVDDLFLWSRLSERGALPAGDRLIEAVRGGEFDAVVSEVDLSRVSSAAAYERQRWSPQLVDAVLSRYRLAREVDGLFVYQRSISRALEETFP